MLSFVTAALSRHRMLPPGTRVVAAVSGGPDSVCLLHVLLALQAERGFCVAGIAHVNHKLRGRESEEDEAFVRQMAKSLGLPIHVRAIEIPSEGNLEQQARRGRRLYFRELIACGAADRVAVGHTRDDQAETVLFRILRGSGTTGLAGILPVTRDGLVRPLLETPRAAVRSYLRENDFPWREDSSNMTADFARNRIRQSLLPQLARDWNPRVSEVLAHLADLAYEEERSWADRIESISANFVKYAGAVDIPVADLTKQDRAVQRRLIRYAIREMRGSLVRIGYEHVEAVLELGLGTRAGSVVFPGGRATRSFGQLRVAGRAVARPEPRMVHDFGMQPWQCDNSLIQLEIMPSSTSCNPCDTLRMEFPPEGLELRAWQPGDRYQPRGATREWTVKELFQKARVPSWSRASWPILTNKGKILWAKQFGPAADASWLAVREIPEGSVNLSGGK